MQAFYNAQASMINRLFTELVVLYEHETKSPTRLTLNLNLPIHIIHPHVSSSTGTGTTALALPGPSRANTRMLNRVRGTLQCPLVQSNRTVGNPTGVKVDSQTRSTGFHVVSSYFQFLMELCVNLSQV